MIAVMDQGRRGDRYPSAPPARPSVTTGAPPSQTAAVARPRVIEVSYWLWLAACLVGVITAAATFGYLDQLQADMLSLVEREFPNETPAKRDEVAAAAVATLIGAGALIVLTQTAFAVAMHSGRGWARFPLLLLTLVVVAYNIVVIGAVPAITAAAGSMVTVPVVAVPAVTKAGLPACTALMVIAVVLMFLPGTRAWFAQRRIARSGGYESSE